MTTRQIDIDAFEAKARESLASATADLAAGRYNSCVNRCYFACFQAAITALIRADVLPVQSEFPHSFVQERFEGILVRRRRLYSPSFVGVLQDLRLLRTQADYRPTGVTSRPATRAVQRATAFVAGVLR